jgi:8-oxo-dGTP pyrophosphatase MutT (NUDIX family)
MAAKRIEMNGNVFQYCPKLVILSHDHKTVLLGKRRIEQDYDAVFSFFGGKMENSDLDILSAIQREKTEEIGNKCWIELFPLYSMNYFFVKKDGNHMVVPHYYSRFAGGEIVLSDEYSEYKWVKLIDLNAFGPKIGTIPEAVNRALVLSQLIQDDQLVRI